MKESENLEETQRDIISLEAQNIGKDAVLLRMEAFGTADYAQQLYGETAAIYGGGAMTIEEWIFDYDIAQEFDVEDAVNMILAWEKERATILGNASTSTYSKIVPCKSGGCSGSVNGECIDNLIHCARRK